MRNKLSFLVALILGLFVVGCSEDVQQRTLPVPKVKTFVVGEHARGQLRRLSGKVIAADISNLSFSVSGTLEEVAVNAGQTVSQGQLLARLESRPFELSVKNARAQLNISRAQLTEKEKKYHRFKQLFERQTIAKADMDIAEAEYSAARNNLDAAKAALENSQRDFEHSVLVAPFSGQVAERLIEPFQQVSLGKTAFVLQSEGVLQVEVLVPEVMIRHIDYGQPVAISFPTLVEVSRSGRIIEIGSQVLAGGAFPVKVELDQAGPDIRPGMSAAVEFNFDQYLKQRTAYLIPLSAIALDTIPQTETDNEASDSLAPLFVFDAESNRVLLRNVRVGGLRGNQIEVFDGLAPGDRVVTAGVAFLRDGMQVSLWDAKHGLVR